MTKVEKYLGAGIFMFLTILVGSLTIFCTVMAYEAATFPYNSEGRYYDGVVVHHSGSELGWGVLALFFFIATFLFARLAFRLVKPNPAFKRGVTFPRNS